MTDTDRAELLPCPFCGEALSEPTPVKHPKSGLAFIHPGVVTDDDCPLSGWGFYEHQLAAWNTRQPAPASDDVETAFREGFEAGDFAGGGLAALNAADTAWEKSSARAALSTTPTMSAEDMREAAAKVADNYAAEWGRRWQDHNAGKAEAERDYQNGRLAGYSDAAAFVATAIRSLPLTKEPSQ